MFAPIAQSSSSFSSFLNPAFSDSSSSSSPLSSTSCSSYSFGAAAASTAAFSFNAAPAAATPSSAVGLVNASSSTFSSSVPSSTATFPGADNKFITYVTQWGSLVLIFISSSSSSSSSSSNPHPHFIFMGMDRQLASNKEWWHWSVPFDSQLATWCQSGSYQLQCGQCPPFLHCFGFYKHYKTLQLCNIKPFAFPITKNAESNQYESSQPIYWQNEELLCRPAYIQQLMAHIANGKFYVHMRLSNINPSTITPLYRGKFADGSLDPTVYAYECSSPVPVEGSRPLTDLLSLFLQAFTEDGKRQKTNWTDMDNVRVSKESSQLLTTIDSEIANGFLSPHLQVPLYVQAFLIFYRHYRERFSGEWASRWSTWTGSSMVQLKQYIQNYLPS